MTASDQTWRRLNSARTTVNPWFHYCLDDVELPTGDRLSFAYQDHPGAVLIVPLTDQGEVVMVRQYRYPINQWSLEVPAGHLDDEAPEQAARRELEEEVGGQCRTLECVGSFYPTSGSSNARCFIFFATGVETGESSPESTEQMEVRRVPVAEALEMARSGFIIDGASILALLLCESRLRENAASSEPVK